MTCRLSLTLFICVAYVLLSCTEKKEPVFKNTLLKDRYIVDYIMSNYDSMYNEERAGGASRQFYRLGSKEHIINRDTNGDIWAVTMYDNNEMVFVREYYSNGQAIIEGKVVKGNFVGPTIHYDSNGHILEVKTYDGDGKPLRWKKVE